METSTIARLSLFAGLFLLPAAHPRPEPGLPGLQDEGRRPVRVEVADYQVHEWGTFTSVLDARGRALTWNPFGFFAPLPGFVHRSEEFKPSYWGTVRMETPVVYFYARRPLTVDARVGFPSGKLTEWYPAATALERALVWPGVKILPSSEATLPTSLSGEHYYAARGVAAAHVRARSGEMEKFLFYRGVGSFEQPLGVRLLGTGEARAIELENRGAQPIEGVLLFEKRDGQAALLELGALAPGSSARVASRDLALSGDVSLAPVEKLLRAHGLFEDEAQAMLATWRRDWFEPGLRVFYVLPRAQTDALLPLELAPAPSELVRVLVSRLELIQPELERDVLEAARAVSSGTAIPDEAFARIGQGLTRFALAVVQARREKEPPLEAAEWQLVNWLQKRADPGAR